MVIKTSENTVCHDSHWVEGIAAVDCGTRFVLTQRDWHMNCIILFAFTFLVISVSEPCKALVYSLHYSFLQIRRAKLNVYA